MKKIIIYSKQIKWKRDDSMDQETKEMFQALMVSLEKLSAENANLKQDIKDVKTSQKELSDKVTTLENKPAVETKRKWDSISGNLWWLFIGGVAAFLLGQALPGIF